MPEAVLPATKGGEDHWKSVDAHSSVSKIPSLSSSRSILSHIPSLSKSSQHARD